MVSKYQKVPGNDNFEKMTYEELPKKNKTTENNKASGTDLISNVVLKKLPTAYLTLLANIFNVCIKLSYLPYSCKIA